MKKLSEMVRPFLSIIFGALLFLSFFNYLQFQGAALAVGIIATVLTAYYVCVGIVNIFVKLEEKTKGLLDMCSIALYLVFLFVVYLLAIIGEAKAGEWGTWGPLGWTLNIIYMSVSLVLALLFVGARLTGNGALGKFTSLFATIFVGSLVLQLAIAADGTQTAFGDIVILDLVMKACFAYMLFLGLGGLNKTPEQKQETEQEETPEVEEK